MLRRRSTLVALVLTAALAPMTACSSEQEQYCDAVADHQVELSELTASGQSADLFAAADVYRDLAEDAPDDIADEWDLVISRIDALAAAVEDAGLDPEDLPPDADLPDEVRQAADRLADQDTGQAMADLEQQALDVCQTPLSR